jgi:hypothetical protein
MSTPDVEHLETLVVSARLAELAAGGLADDAELFEMLERAAGLKSRP